MRTTIARFALLAGSALAIACGGTARVEESPGPDARPAPEPVPPTPTAVSCTFDATAPSGRGALAWVRGADVVFVDASGDARTVHSFPTNGVEATGSFSVALSARDGRVLAAAGWSDANGATQSELVLLDAEGTKLAIWSKPGIWLDSPRLGAAGLGVANRYEPAGLVALDATGAVREVDGFVAIGPATAQGVPVQGAPSEGGTPPMGWLDVASGAFVASAKPPGTYPIVAGDALVYTAAQGAGSQLVVETPAEVATLALPEGVGSAVGASLGASRVLLQGTDFPTTPWLVDLASDHVAAVANQTGKQPFGVATYFGPSFDDDGALLQVMRDAHEGALFRSADAGASWQRVGGTFSQIWDIGVVHRGGTYVTAATDEPGYFPMDPWEPAADGSSTDHVGPTVEVVRPADGIARTLELQAPAPWYPTTFALDATGACAAFIELSDEPRTRLRSLDVITGVEVELLDVEGTTWTTPVWIEGG